MTSRAIDRKRAVLRAALVLIACGTAAPLRAAAPPDAAPAPSIQDATRGCERRDGLLTTYVDHRGGRVLLELRPDGARHSLGRYLYQAYLRSGLGSAPVGLDRSAMADTQIIAFRRAGSRVVAQLENSAFRAERGTEAERAAVRESFAPSLIWSGSVLAEDGDGRVLVDIAGLLTRDAAGVAEALASAQQGDFRLEAALTYVDAEAVAVFPENLEFEAVQTFSSDRPGP
ncbi:MAG: DUF5117 domain-containing protein, partial [Proteobacteria bacterium]|nr:DUF5117 domain-containing protein [Pseudomonadota bacterium]